MAEGGVVDQDLYSRQLYVLGMDAMKRMTASSVLISGINGLGIEIAKNACLTGVRNVCIHDTKPVTIGDLAANFYLSEAAVGQNRAAACLQSLKALNSYVTVSCKTDPLTEQFIRGFTVVVLADSLPQDQIDSLSGVCHAAGVKLIVTETRGVFGWVFVDFGDEFVTQDATGEQPLKFMLSYVSQAEEAVVTLAEGESHDLGEGDSVRFSEVEGMTNLNGDTAWHVSRIFSASQFSIKADSRSWPPYSGLGRAGWGERAVLPTTLQFKRFWDALGTTDRFGTFDFCAWGRDQQVVLAFTASHYEGDLLAKARALNEKYKVVEQIDEKLFAEFVREAGTCIAPTCATFGGIVAHEVLKAVSSKFTPISQFVATGFLDALPEVVEFKAVGDRYDPYRQVFGNALQEKVRKLKYFMIGAGALGCEQLKNFALMGVATAGDGVVTVADPDRIERSNLSRQFLFRDRDIGKMKAECAGAAAQAINPQFKVRGWTHKVCAETAHIFSDAFYLSLDGVCNALDNVSARLLSDQNCVFYGKPLLESGTLGPKAHVQIVVPNVTESYGSSVDPPEREFPACTIHNFPTTTHHCVVWARDLFGLHFELDPGRVNTVLSDPGWVEKNKSYDAAQTLAALKAVDLALGKERPSSWADCVRWARLLFEQSFVWNVLDLTSQFPRDAAGKDGLPFWAGGKRFPEPARYDPAVRDHAAFVRSAARLRAELFGLPVGTDAVELGAKVDVPAWKPSGKAVKVDEEAQGQADAPDPEAGSLDELWARVRPLVGGAKPLQVVEFEKDDDSNGHMEFIAAAANIRAVNYSIEPEDPLTIKRIAGKIIPAIATTTAMICGLVAIELYKVHALEPKPLEAFRFGTINLAIGLFALGEPVPVRKQVSGGHEFTMWDKWVIEGDLTLQQFLDVTKERYGLTVDMISVGKGLVYTSWECVPGKKAYGRLGRRLQEILVTDFGQPALTPEQVFIAITASCSDAEGNDVETPQFVLKVR